MNNTSDFIPVPKLILFLIITMILSLILSVLMLGFNKMFLDGSRGYPVRFEDLFYGFRHHPDRIILMQLLMVLIYLVCYAPAMVMLIWASLTDASWTFVLIGMLLMLVGSVLIIYFSLSFSQAMYLMADYDDLGPVQALKESQKLMIGNKGRLFYIQLSFLVLELLSLLTCGLASLWIFPYMSMTLTNFYRNLGEEI